MIERTRRRSDVVRSVGVAVTIRRGAATEPVSRIASSVGRPATTMTRRYVVPSHRSIAFRRRRRSAHTVKSKRNGAIGRTISRVDATCGTCLAGRALAIRHESVGGHRRSAHLRPQIVLERHRVVVLLVMGTVDERHRAAPGGGHDRPPSLRLRVELPEVPPAEPGPPLRIMAEPLPQFGAGSHVLEPGVRRIEPTMR